MSRQLVDRGWERGSPLVSLILFRNAADVYDVFLHIGCDQGQSRNKCQFFDWDTARWKIKRPQVFVYVHIFLRASGHKLVILYDSTHSTHAAFTVAACPLTSAASKIGERPCRDLSHSCSCWLRTLVRQSNTFTRWTAELQKYAQLVSEYSWRNTVR